MTITEKQKRLKMTYPEYFRDLQEIMKTEEGRRFIMSLIRQCEPDEKHEFTENPLLLSYMEGRRYVGSTLLGDVRLLSDGVEQECLMRQEAVRDRLDAPDKEESEVQNILRNAL